LVSASFGNLDIQPTSRNSNFLHGLSDGRDRRLVDIWPRDRQRFTCVIQQSRPIVLQGALSEEALPGFKSAAEFHTLIDTLYRGYI